MCQQWISGWHSGIANDHLLHNICLHNYMKYLTISSAHVSPPAGKVIKGWLNMFMIIIVLLLRTSGHHLHNKYWRLVNYLDNVRHKCLRSVVITVRKYYKIMQNIPNIHILTVCKNVRSYRIIFEHSKLDPNFMFC